MTAALEPQLGRRYPERLSVRITRDDYDLYDALEDLPDEVTISHVVVALLRRWHDNPDLQAQILREAHEIANERRARADSQRSRSMKETIMEKARRRRLREEAS